MFVQRKKVFHKIIGFNKIYNSSQRQNLHTLNNTTAYFRYLSFGRCFQTVAEECKEDN